MRRIIFISILVSFNFIQTKAQNNTFLHSIDSLLSGWAKENTPGFSVAVIRNGNVAYTRSSGLANIKKARPIDSTTQFWLASVTKQFTAAAIYILKYKNKINLDHSVRYYLKELPELFEPVTINHLLHHTSGIRDGFVLTALSKKNEEAYTNENVIKYLRQQQNLNFTPGTEFEYNNSGYVLLAMVIEKISETGYPEFLKQNIFLPVGMKDSYISGKYQPDEHLAEGYQRINSPDSPEIFGTTHFTGDTYGSTGLITTTVDLIKWAKALQYPENFPNIPISSLFETAKLIDGKQIAYGGGFERFSYKGQAVFEHFGADPGFKANIIYFPASKTTVIGLVNNSSNYDLSKKLYAIADVVLSNKQETADLDTSDKTMVFEECYYDSSLTPVFRSIKNYGDYAEVSEIPEGNALRYNSSGDIFKNNNPIPTTFRLTNKDLLIIDQYYGNYRTLKKITLSTEITDLNGLEGEYYSSELEVSYKIISDNRQLFLEFAPGMRFLLQRLTKSDFMFEYSGPNFVQFTAAGFTFSREGCRKLEFTKHR